MPSMSNRRAYSIRASCAPDRSIPSASPGGDPDSRKPAYSVNGRKAGTGGLAVSDNRVFMPLDFRQVWDVGTYAADRRLG